MATDDFNRKAKLLKLKAISHKEYDISKNQVLMIQTELELQIPIL